jgi:pyrimidine operon attenuation protein / uracil phosphoribosyltransferase
MQVLLEQQQFERTLDDLADRIRSDIPAGKPVAVVGVLRRGDALARRLAERLGKAGLEVGIGALDITLYRDDLATKGPEAVVRSTEIPFDVTGRYIVLVDDVLYTGRTSRAALDALTDLGRPVAIRLAVLVERPGRQMPIQADYAGLKVTRVNGDVRVFLRETDGQDRVEMD